MKKILIILSILFTTILISCSQDENIDNTITQDETPAEPYYSIKRIEPIVGVVNYTYDYRYNASGNVISLWDIRNEPEQWYEYNYNSNGDLINIEIRNTEYFVNDVNYRGQIDIIQYDDFIFLGNLNLYSLDTNEFVETLFSYEITFNGQLITSYVRTSIELEATISYTLVHDDNGRLLEMNENVYGSDHPKWISTDWTEQKIPMYSVLQFRGWAQWFPDKFVSLYAVKNGSYEGESARTFNYNYPTVDNSILEIEHYVSNLTGRRVVTYESY